MIPRERLELALNHKEPDRIPLDLGSSMVTGVTVTALKNYLQYIGMEEQEIKLVDIVQQLAYIPEALLQDLKVDTRGIWANHSSKWKLELFEEERFQKFKDEWGIVWKMPKVNGFYFDMQVHPLADIDTVEDLKNYSSWLNPEEPNRFKGIREKAQKIVDSGYALVMGNPAGIIETPGWLRGFENWYCDLAINEKFAEALLDKICEIQYRFAENTLAEIGDLLTVYVDYEDSGSQNGPLISKEMFRKFIMPHLKKIYSMVKSKSKAKIFVHSCGSIYDLIPDFIEAGVDILNPVQISAAKMDPVVLKKEFGNDLTFWGGGVETQRILPRGTPKEVEECIKRQIDILAPGGGFVFNTVHNIQADVPPQNIEALFNSFEKYCKY